MRHRGAHLALDIIARGLQLALDVDVARGDERVNPRPLGVPDRLPRCVDVLLGRPRQPADHRALHLPRDCLHRLEVTRRGDREARLDYVDAQARQLLGDLQLLLPVQGYPRGLLPIAQGRVEDPHTALIVCRDAALVISCGYFRQIVHVALLLVLSPARFSCGYAATRPPRAIPPEGGAEEVEGRMRTTCSTQVSTHDRADQPNRAVRPSTKPSEVTISSTTSLGTGASVVTTITASLVSPLGKPSGARPTAAEEMLMPWRPNTSPTRPIMPGTSA